MENLVSKDAIQITKKVHQARLLVEEGLSDVVYGSEDQWAEEKLKRTRNDIDELCKKHPWLSELARGYMLRA